VIPAGLSEIIGAVIAERLLDLLVLGAVFGV
jgi:hypothetical protein